MKFDNFFNIEIKSKIIKTLNESEINLLRDKTSFLIKLKRKIKFIFINFINRLPLKKKYIFHSRKLDRVEAKYDKIAGNYLDNYINKDNQTYIAKLNNNEVVEINMSHKNYISSVISNVYEETNSKSIFEVGAGELTTLFDSIKKIKKKNLVIDKIGALDLSFNRLKVGKDFFNENNFNIDYIAKANAEKIPFKSNSFDFVFTCHCLEQVPHLFQKIFKELLRVSRKYIILIEPSYEFGTPETRDHIIKKGYLKITKNLLSSVGYNPIFREKFPVQKYINGSELIIFEKKTVEINQPNFTVPGTDIELHIDNNLLVSKNKENKYDFLSGIGVFE